MEDDKRPRMPRDKGISALVWTSHPSGFLGCTAVSSCSPSDFTKFVKKLVAKCVCVRLCVYVSVQVRNNRGE